MFSIMSPILIVMVLTSASLVLCQRPFFAGSRPIGFPETPNRTTTVAGLGDRFGEVDGTTPRLPIEANGDRDLIDRLSKLPIDNQPFWFINWQAIEAHRQKPQTYPQRPNGFVDPVITNSNTPIDDRFGNGNSNPANANSGTSNSTVLSSNTSVTNSTFLNSNAGTANSATTVNSNSDINNRFNAVTPLTPNQAPYTSTVHNKINTTKGNLEQKKTSVYNTH